MKEIARSFVWWPNCDKDIEFTVRNCSTCQQVKSPPAMAPLTPWTWPTMPWARVHIDYAEKGRQSFLVVVDAHSRWPEIIAVPNTTAATTINALRDLFSKYGIPFQVVSDNGPQFCSAEFEGFLKGNGVKHVRVAPYHAASNGLAERMVQSFKHSYHASKQDQMSMQQSITNFLLIYRCTTHPTTGCTPAKLFLGRELRTRLSLVKPEAQTNVIMAQGRQKYYHDWHSKYREFYPGDAVLVKDLRRDKTWWPGTVVERSTPKSYVIVLSDGRVWKQHIDHLRRKETEPASQMTTPKDAMSVTINDEFDDVQGDHIDESGQIPYVEPAKKSDVEKNQHPEEPKQHSTQSTTPNKSVEPQTPVKLSPICRQSTRKVKPPDRLIESI